MSSNQLLNSSLGPNVGTTSNVSNNANNPGAGSSYGDCYESNSYDSGGGVMASLDSSIGYSSGPNGSNSFSNTSGGPSSAKTSFFSNSSQSKYEDLKQMLESSKELPKLEAMKRIITMVAKGRSAESARELFPHVVKNVVTKNTELKKLVYLYLTRYAEQEQDLALLSIATFQHALKDPNPLIRGSAVRVLSSIRVPMISPIMLIAIKDCANDMSPYVRKTAAHAIPKLYSLDPDIKNEVIDIIAKLLSDKVSLVLGSAVAAFEEICPDRFDLIHENYRKLCSLLVDVDEWGQIIIINMLLRYARTQFLNPNKCQNGSKVDPDLMLLIRSIKPLLQSRNSGVVLAVIQLYLSVAPHFELSAQLIRPLIRLLHSHHEIQLIILKNIVTLTSVEFNQQYYNNKELESNTSATHSDNAQNGDSKIKKNKIAKNSDNDDSDEDDSEVEEDEEESQPITSNKSIKSLFDPYLKSFFVKANDSTQTKILKLEILTNLSNSANISLILREFQAYIMNYQDDLEFMSATIESIGQCASRIKEIAPICLNGLVSLLSNRNETIVAQSIVVIRTQIINKDESIISMIVRQIVKLMEKISTPHARATIVWIVAEFCSRNSYALKVGPDVLRIIARSFTNENDLVKLQALNLAAKLYIKFIGGEQENCEISLDNLERLKLLINYVFNVAKYDLNYDVRDRGRFLRQLLNDYSLAKKILLVPKLVPNVSQRSEPFLFHSSGGGSVTNEDQNKFNPSPLNKLSNSVDSARFRIGTLSHFLGKKVFEYEELPDWPEHQPDPSVRQPKVIESSVSLQNQLSHNVLQGLTGVKPFSSKSNGFLSDESENDEDDDDDDEEEDEEGEDEEEEEESEAEESEVEEDEENEIDEDEEYDEECDDEENEEESSEDSDSYYVNKSKNMPKSSTTMNKKSNSSNTNVDLLLDLSDLTITDSVNSPSIQTNNSPLLPTTLLDTQNSVVQSETFTGPYRVLGSAEHISFKEFNLVEVAYNFRALYRFPRINEEQRTLVEVIIKNELPLEQSNDDNATAHNNRITIQAPSTGSVLFKNLDAQDNTATVQLAPGETRLVTLAIDFNESPSLGVELQFNRAQTVKLSAPLGEILNPVRFHTIEAFETERSKLTGMNEVIGDISLTETKHTGSLREKLDQIVLSLANVCTNKHLVDDQGDNESKYRYSACTLKFKSFILITIQITNDQRKQSNQLQFRTIVNCEKMVLGSMLSKLIKDECIKQL